jgi:hypothetical protein
LGGLGIVYVAISSLAASYVGATITACPFDIVGPMAPARQHSAHDHWGGFCGVLQTMICADEQL